ncbi:MAG: TRAP transporter substrate-binding protein [Deltaproteobacteria bacterium]|nr:TRAP transporter substrate-binding protein [Deltaproteobacteria bacterium]
MQRVSLSLAIVLAAAPAYAEDNTMILATVAPPDSPWSALLTKFKENVEAKSAKAGKKITVKLKLGGMLGDENETVTKCRRGQIQAVGASTGALASQVPELNVVELPYLFRNADEADAVIDHVLTKELEPLFAQRGLVLGFWSENGFRHFGTRDGFVTKVEHLRGKKMRSQESPVHIGMYEAFGASPVPIPTTEVPQALATGNVDGFDQSALYALATAWHKSVKYFTISEHIYQPAAIVFNAEWYGKLSPDVQKILVDEGRALQVKGRNAVREIFPDLIEIMKADKVQVYTLTAEERKPFEAASKPVWDKYRKTHGKLGDKLLDASLAELATFRSNKK